MRQIKFRGLRTDGKGWVYGDLLQNYIHHNTGATIQQNGCIVYEVHAYSVGQFTGLKDRNGKEIFEGDIVEFKTRRYHLGYDKGLQTIKFKSAVDYEDGSFVLTEKQKNDTYLEAINDSSHIIGTIHDRKEVESITCGYCDCEFEKGTGGNYGEYGEVCANCYIGLS